MKIYLHKRLLLSFIVMLALCVFCWFMMRDEQYSFKSVFCFCCMAILAIVFLVMQWQYRTHENWELAIINSRKVVVEFTDDTIVFPNGYHFRLSSIYRERVIAAGRINEVMLDTYPQSIVVDDKEVIFLTGEAKDELSAFARRNKIPISVRTDIWSYILEPFLDTELEADEKVKYIEVLAGNGVPPKEVNALRRRCALPMLLNTYFTMEWEYYGHYDYLKQTTISERGYWKSMEIALRNYKPRNTEC